MRLWDLSYIATVCLVLVVDLAPAQDDSMAIPYPSAQEINRFYMLDTTNRRLLRTILDSAEAPKAGVAALFLAERGDQSVTPSAERRIGETLVSDDPHGCEIFLVALYRLQASSTTLWINAYIDTILAHRDEFTDERVLWHVELLVRLKDYSRYNLVSSFFDQPIRPGPYRLRTLGRFGLCTSLRSEVYTRLKGFVQDPDSLYRDEVLPILYWFPEMSDLRDIYIKAINTESAISVRMTATQLLSHLGGGDLSTIIGSCEQIATSVADSSLLFDQAMMVLEGLNTPYGYAALEGIANSIPTGGNKEYAQICLRNYEPDNPSYDEEYHGVHYTARGLADSLDSFYRQCSELGWIGGETFAQELFSRISRVRALIAEGDSSHAVFELRRLQSAVKEAHVNPAPDRSLTEGAYLYLYYPAQYVLDHLPAPVRIDLK